MDIKNILLDLYHHLITVEQCDTLIRELMVSELQKNYTGGGCRPDDIPQGVFDYNDGVNSCVQAVCNHDALERIDAINNRSYHNCKMCGYTKEITNAYPSHTPQ